MKGSRVLVLGVTYKRDIEDVRESPALDILRILEKRGAPLATTTRTCRSWSLGRASSSCPRTWSPR